MKMITEYMPVVKYVCKHCGRKFNERKECATHENECLEYLKEQFGCDLAKYCGACAFLKETNDLLAFRNLCLKNKRMVQKNFVCPAFRRKEK